ncbi:DUF4291 family protein [Streptosporangium amethystogenes subsp. fukuiense]|uniref:DUF4291 family protein n=1 Tax=Streptosporangium amethystogenes subsp. fukuiense TaxID=698418 RepID=A0ABW2T6V7_9ACTN
MSASTAATEQVPHQQPQTTCGPSRPPVHSAPALTGKPPGRTLLDAALAIEIIREGFEWALRHSCLSHYERGLHLDQATWKRQLKHAPARVQWDPERDLRLQPLTYRSLQLGLSGEGARRYVDEWIIAITDVTPLAREIHTLMRNDESDTAVRLLPEERPYPAGDDLLAHLRP